MDDFDPEQSHSAALKEGWYTRGYQVVLKSFSIACH